MKAADLRSTVTRGSIGSHATLIAFFTVITKVSGFVRDRIFAHELGAGRTADIYYAAFKIPDFIFNIIIVGALSSAFIPLFLRTYRESTEEGFAFANNLLNILGVALAIIIGIVALCMPQLTSFIVPGFSPQEHDTVVMVSRLMLLSVVFFSISNVMGGILNAFERFIIFSISPLLYNVGIVFGILYFYPRYGVYGLAFGVIIGAAAHCLLQLIGAYHLGWRFQLLFKIDKRIRTLGKIMIPRIIDLGSSQINLLVTTGIISYLSAGSLAVYTYAYNIQSLPVSIIGVSFALAAFPSFSYSLAEGNWSEAHSKLIGQIRRILYLTLPAAALLLLLRAHIVRVILGSGAFDWQATYATAQTLGYFSLSLVAQSLIPLLTRFFFAAENTKTPTIITAICVTTNIVLAWLLSLKFGIVGVAAAFSISSSLQCLLLYAALVGEHAELHSQQLLRYLARLLAITALCALITYVSLGILAGLVNNRTFIGIFSQAALAGSAGMLAYALLSMVYTVPEFNDLVRKARAIISTLTRKL